MLNYTRALLSVTCKTGPGLHDIGAFARELLSLGVTEIIASGGTKKYLESHGITVTDTAELISGFVRECLTETDTTIPEKLLQLLGKPFLKHRVATLSAEIHACIISNHASDEDARELAERFLKAIDIVCVDFYELKKEIEREGSTFESVIEKRDIGGPTMVLSAAKGGRPVIAHENDRAAFIKWMREGRQNEEAVLKMMAAKAEYIVLLYQIESTMYRGQGQYDAVCGVKIGEGKGENEPQGPMSIYAYPTDDPLAFARFAHIEGNPMGFVNCTDLDRLLQTMTHAAAGFETNINNVGLLAFGVKHGNCCGGAWGIEGPAVIKQMLEGDLEAIFGGFIMVNFEIDATCADTLIHYALDEGVKRRLLDGIVAPGFTPEAIEILGSKSGRCRLIVNPALAHLGKESLDTSPHRTSLRYGHIKQKSPTYVPLLNRSNPDIAIYGELSDDQIISLVLAYAICVTSNSNTMTLVKGRMLIGNGVGQQSRVRAGRLALYNATASRHDPKEAVAWSDSFFPFPDGPQVLIEGGAKVIFATSGSKNDHLTIELCKQHGITLIMIPDSIARGFFGHGS